MKNIYFVQPTTDNVSTTYFPYAAACLASYAWSFEEIQKNYRLKETIFIREPIESALARFDNPFLVGFSNYLWNFEYNKTLAEKLKERYPQCIIVFGGPHVPSDTVLLEKYDFIDILQHMEGEISFRDMLLALAHGMPLTTVNNLSFRTDSGIVTTPFVFCEKVDFPSPYQTGFMDELMRKHPNLRFDALIETNRGCPHKCSYCSWGGVNGRVRQFSLERVFADLEWCSSHKIEFIGFADANFGMFPRDEIIVDKIIELKKKTGYPQKFQVSYVSYSKGSWERLFRITQKLSDNDLAKGVTLSFQSMSPAVQTNIGRNNMNAENYKFQLAKYAQANIATYTDLILGLPGETLISFKEGIEELLELGQHTSLFVHLCEWLPLAQMGDKAYMERFKIRYSKIPLNQPHMRKLEDSVTEYSRIITSTSSMSAADWEQMNLFSACVLCFHHLRLMQFVGLYLFDQKHIRYTDFYASLLEFLLSDDCQIDVFNEIKALSERVITDNGPITVFDDRFGDVAWPPEEYAFLRLVVEKEKFFKCIKPFLNRFFGNEALLDELLEYQSFCIKHWSPQMSEKTFSYDWKVYFDALLVNRNAVLKKETVTYRITPTETFGDIADYARKVVWYGRRGGRNIYIDEIERIDNR